MKKFNKIVGEIKIEIAEDGYSVHDDECFICGTFGINKEKFNDLIIRSNAFEPKPKENTLNNKDTKFEELEKAVKPMIEFLNKYYNPMTTAIITEGRVDIVSNEMGMPLKVRD